MKKYFLMAALMLLSMSTFAITKAKAKANTQAFNYDITCAGNGAAGTYLVRVSSYSKKQVVAADSNVRDAVHGVIFKGFGAGEGCVAQKALVRNPGAEIENRPYFSAFFDNNEYRKFASVVAGTMETSKVGGTYCVTQTVCVYKDELRKTLEAAGVVSGLGSIF